MAATNEFIILAKVEIQPERLSEFLSLMEEDIRDSLTLENGGCLAFDVMRSNTNPNVFRFYEVYKDQEAFNYHKTTPHFQKFLDFKSSGGIVSLEGEQLTRIMSGK